MNILLDTHSAFWAIIDDPRLSQNAKDLILDPLNNIYFSTVSTWEILLKHARRPKEFDMDSRQFTELCMQTGFLPLNLLNQHIHEVDSLRRPYGAPEHKDPFDRLLLAQAKAENLLFLTHDRKIIFYNESCVILY